MPKLKTRKGVRKRVRISGTGKVKYFKAGKGHLLTSKRSKRKRSLRTPGILSKSENRMINEQLPYGA